jgi:hypothetical protein
VMNNPGYDETPVGDPALQAQSWFAGKMERDTAKEAITGHPDGTFLIRASSRHDGYVRDGCGLGVCFSRGWM